MSHTTARQWLGLLETSFIAFRLPPFRANLRKRLVKTPKLYFYDVGLASYLIGIERPEQIVTHPLRGPLFENMVVVEALKYRYNLGRPPQPSRSSGTAGGWSATSSSRRLARWPPSRFKSGATVGRGFFSTRSRPSREQSPGISMKAVVYGRRGPPVAKRRRGRAIRWASTICSVVSRSTRRWLPWFRTRLESEPPDTGDRMLDALYARHIRPTIDGVEGSMRKGVASLFRKMQRQSYLRGAHRQVNSSSLLDPRHWQRVKDEQIAMVGSRIGGDHPLEIIHELTLAGYNRLGGFGADLVVSLSWRLEKEGVLHRASVAGTPGTQTRDPYSVRGFGHAERTRRPYMCSDPEGDHE